MTTKCCEAKTMFIISTMAGMLATLIIGLAFIPQEKTCTINKTFNRVECCVGNQCDIYNL